MTDEFETLYRLAFFSTAALLVLLERVRAFQRQPVQIGRRWTSNVGLFLIGGVVTALVLPVGIYAFAQEQPPGLLARLGLPFAAQLLMTFLLLDIWRYWEHRLFHRVPLLWRLHLVHHSDTQIDATTSERHHPIEVLLSTAVMMTLIGTLGLPAQAIGLYLLTATVIALCSHANLRLLPALDGWLSRLIVTPRVHAVHHSELQAQTDSNYGSVLTIWDRLFGSYVDPERAKTRHFGLSYFHLPKDNGLAGVLQQPFLFRVGLVYPERSSHGGEANSAVAASGTAMSHAWRDALLGSAAGCTLACLVLWPTWLEMSSSWRNNEAYQYAWLVMPMVAYLLGWHHRQHSLAVSPRPDYKGVFVAIFAAACWGAAVLMNIDVGRQFALVLALQGIAMSVLGWRPYWRLFPTLALMFLMIPTGDVLQPGLRVLTVKAIELFAAVADLPHSVDGFVIFIGEHRYVVVDECSGLPNVILATFLGYCFGLLLYRSLLKIAALALFGAFLGIFSNVLRVNAIVLIDWVRGSQMELAAHGGIQWMALLISLALLFYVLSRLRADATPIAFVAVASGRATPARRFAPVAAGLSVLLIAGSVDRLTTTTPQPPRGPQTGTLPQEMLGWRLVSPAPSWAVDHAGHSESLTLTYRRNGQDMRVVIVEPLSPNAKLPESRLAPDPGNDWRENRVEKQISCVESNCLTLMHRTWQRGKSQELRHVYYAYSIGGYITESKLALRTAHGWHRLTGSRSNPQLIGLIVDDTLLAIDDAAAAFRMLKATLDPGSAPSKHAKELNSGFPG